MNGLKREILRGGLAVGLEMLCTEPVLPVQGGRWAPRAPLFRHHAVQGPLPTPIATDENEHNFRL